MEHKSRVQRSGQEGVALLLVILATIILLGAVALVTYRVIDAKRFTDMAVDRVILDEACKAGIDYGVQQVWGAYVESAGGEPGNLASYKEFIDGLVPNSEDLNENGAYDPEAGEYDSDADGTFEINSPQLLISGDAPLTLSGGDAEITSLTLARFDDLTGSSLRLRATAQVGGKTRSVEQTIRVSGAPFDGFEYAVLANNINCILCHAEFRALDLEYNTDPNKYDTFKRIKVAALESMLLRPWEAASNVAGTVYTRGTVTDQSGRELSESSLASSTFKGYAFDGDTGNLEQSSTGALGTTSLVQAALDENGHPLPMANLYKNYPTSTDAMKDGSLPLSFPAPYPDVNENRNVDAWEFTPVMTTAQGSISGGIAYGVPSGETYAANALPTVSNDALADLSDGTYSGNAILVGTDDNPIVIEGTVAIDGDLVLAGKMKGAGKIMVKRNAYVVGDVTYADAPGEFGVAEDGGENAVALVSGGSILMGDYLTIRGKSHSADMSKYPDSSKSIRAREAHKTATKTIDGVTQTLQYGYFDPGSTDAGEIQPTMLDAYGNEITRTGQQYSFTTSELMLFNNLELQKALADPSYHPRFYGLRDAQPDDIYVYDSPDEHSVRYDEAGGGVKLLSDYLVENDLPLDLLTNAAIHYMNPESNWIGEDQLRQIWWNDEQTRPSSRRPFKFDGLLYSNNAIFTITRSYARHGSYSDGRMLIRGAVIAPDLGVLIPGNGGSTEGLRLLYDRRVKRFYQLEDTTQVAFNRVVFKPLDYVQYAEAGGQ